MNTLTLTLGYAVFTAVVPVVFVHAAGVRNRILRSWYYLVTAIIYLVLAALLAHREGAPAGVGLPLGSAVLVYLSWRESRPPRDGMLSRVLGRVRDLGHRLVVAPS